MSAGVKDEVQRTSETIAELEGTREMRRWEGLYEQLRTMLATAQVQARRSNQMVWLLRIAVALLALLAIRGWVAR